MIATRNYFRCIGTKGLCTFFDPTTIRIPCAVKRKSTDLLQALAKTVDVDTTAPHFSFTDDPALIPTHTASKRNFYLAKEMGKRVARHLAEEWPTLFMYDLDEPRIAAFRPQKTADPLNIEATVENLEQFIEKKEVRSSVILYESIRAASRMVPRSVQLDLFRLLAYYNESDVPCSESEDWHGLRNFFSEESTMRWKGQVAEILFEEIGPSSETYSIMIAGLSKYPTTASRSRVKSLYQEMKENELVPSVEAFTGLVQTTQSYEDAEDYVRYMAQLGIKPSIVIFNQLMNPDLQNRRENVLNILREILKLNVKPNLRTFTNVLNISHLKTAGEKRLAVSLLFQILDELDSHASIIISERDEQNFFIKAMEVAAAANNLTLAERIQDLYSSPKNQIRLASFTEENLFFQMYLNLCIKKLPVEKLKETYFSFVPRVVGTTQELISTMLDVSLKEPCWPLTLRVIEDAIASKFLVYSSIASAIQKVLLSTNVNKLDEPKFNEFCIIVEKLVKAWLDYSRRETKRYELAPNRIVGCAHMLIKANKSEDGWKFLKMLVENKDAETEESNISQGFLPTASILPLMEEAISSGTLFNACLCLQIIAEYCIGEPLQPHADRIEREFQINARQTSILHNFARTR